MAMATAVNESELLSAPGSAWAIALNAQLSTRQRRNR
jgi:hypothetical protein